MSDAKLPAEGDRAILWPGKDNQGSSPTVATFCKGRWVEDATGRAMNPKWVGDITSLPHAKAAGRLAEAARTIKMTHVRSVHGSALVPRADLEALFAALSEIGT